VAAATEKEKHMKSKELLNKIEHFAGDVGKKTRKLVHERKSDIASAIGKGKKKIWR
jgi:hypothetical protein